MRREAELRAGEEALAPLTYALPHELRVTRLDGGGVARRIEATIRFLREWSGRCSYRGAVRRSALVLKALPTPPWG